MRSVQLIGFLLSLVAFAGGAYLLSLVTPDMPAYSASAIGLPLLTIVLPLFGISAAMLVPSSLLLLAARFRVKFHVTGAWFGLWCINIVLSLVFTAIGVSVLWVLWSSRAA